MQCRTNVRVSIRANDCRGPSERSQSKSPSLATENLLENTDRVLSGRLPATSIYADACYTDAVIISGVGDIALVFQAGAFAFPSV